MNQGRFRVEVDGRDFQGQAGLGQVVPFGSEDSGLKWFFSSENWKMLVKVLDGCGIIGRYWVYSAATTDVGYTLRVTDTATGAVREYDNPLGDAAAAITDTEVRHLPIVQADPAASPRSPRERGLGFFMLRYAGNTGRCRN